MVFLTGQETNYNGNSKMSTDNVKITNAFINEMISAGLITIENPPIKQNHFGNLFKKPTDPVSEIYTPSQKDIEIFELNKRAKEAEAVSRIIKQIESEMLFIRKIKYKQEHLYLLKTNNKRKRFNIKKLLILLNNKKQFIIKEKRCKVSFRYKQDQFPDDVPVFNSKIYIDPDLIFDNYDESFPSYEYQLNDDTDTYFDLEQDEILHDTAINETRGKYLTFSFFINDEIMLTNEPDKLFKPRPISDFNFIY